MFQFYPWLERSGYDRQCRVEHWPGVAQQLVEVFGPAAVWIAGLVVLGYPPTWIGSVAEVVKIHEYLTRGSAES